MITAIGPISAAGTDNERAPITEATTTTGSTAAPTDLAADQFEWAPTNKQPESRYKKRAGYTTNKWRGASKTRRKMAAASRRRNRAP